MSVTGSIEFFNLDDEAKLISPSLIIRGKCNEDKEAKTIKVEHPQLPSLEYPIHESTFRATVILTPGENRFTFTTNTGLQRIIKCHYTPMLQDQPVHLCLLLAKDSEYVFDSTTSQKEKEKGHGLDLAIKKLRCGARLMQAYTNEQMLRAGFGNRTFSFVEEFAKDTLFRSQSTMRSTVKVHLLHSDRTVEEIRDHDVAQQNRQAKRSGALYEYAMEALVKYGGPFTNSEKPVQAAVVFMDSHWDGQFITGHAALGGGNDAIKLAIFGSHGLYSWPTCMEDIVPYFSDATTVSTKEVANDNGQCGSHWECLTVTLGAFLHEIGHSLGCPHQEYGVMLRDYPVFNRSFLTEEAFSTRTNSNGVASPIDPSTECKWHHLDLLRFLYHPSFTLPEDYYDPTFHRPSKIGGFVNPRPAVYPLGNETCKITSKEGIYSIEIFCGDLAKGYIEYLPKSLGGPGPQTEVTMTLKELQSHIPAEMIGKYGESFGIKILAVNAPEADIGDFASLLKVKGIPMEKYGFSADVKGIKSVTFGSANAGSDTGIIAFHPKSVKCVRIYYGQALDGMRFFLEDSNILFGSETSHFEDFELDKDEYITRFNVRSGQWVDAIQVVTNKGRESKMAGNVHGGGLGVLEPPEGHLIIGMHGRLQQWLQGIGIVYGEL
ncbi:hypothetical protein Kpol_1039p30 [Vanderwaltozyma polyspora DSM 70294]|uniref:Jacalin-type lectin domain-containing protein n=1 Tax=Vanderwaltozyma polyspora (strain ATCC 22028 / DSM 70294 / BCRC 21397 / CBS 2163 / NBRC 10782 / NRRL Y-8283 / UCD 57-17) TaxID=436907 RepID=A7THF7_VANPO|nr:uncharacterized protein Kpol_1039p30 [Vanderwaltozyma polyspora DSM 70294]EDO18281.1 hypothetical protein Kpol_1039p30 [Vanderwaltozyma polyspora DSM 70294]